MIDPLESLRAALQDRYAVERLIGQGGMATVYLAGDYRHDREVAIKVLRSELAASLGSDRFLREIKVAARLQHPHILPLYDSGESGGFLYYVMPFVQGESLRARMDREEQLPLPDAIQLTCESTGDGNYNNFRGWTVDQVAVRVGAALSSVSALVLGDTLAPEELVPVDQMVFPDRQEP